MNFQTAINLIAKAVRKTTEPQLWADLGAGEGLFARALSTLLPPGSSIVAVDKNEAALKSIRIHHPGISLVTKADDFTKIKTETYFDGILMANSLHYVEDQAELLSRLRMQLKLNGNLVIVEYERVQPNPWVPNPIPSQSLKTIAPRAGFKSVELLEEVPSIYDHVKIYSAVLR